MDPTTNEDFVEYVSMCFNDQRYTCIQSNIFWLVRKWNSHWAYVIPEMEKKGDASCFCFQGFEDGNNADNINLVWYSFGAYFHRSFIQVRLSYGRFVVHLPCGRMQMATNDEFPSSTNACLMLRMPCGCNLTCTLWLLTWRRTFESFWILVWYAFPLELSCCHANLIGQRHYQPKPTMATAMIVFLPWRIRAIVTIKIAKPDCSEQARQ